VPSQTPPPAIPSATARDKSDHTDDLYFRRGRTKSKRRKPVDPNQLDLFGPQKN
jgi:hypothetical protein